jgi:hypothetical protein
LNEADVPSVAAATDGFTGADLKRLIEDAKLLFAYDKVRNVGVGPATDYFLRAAQTVRQNKDRYAQAEAAARPRRAERPPWFQVAMAEALSSSNVQTMDVISAVADPQM